MGMLKYLKDFEQKRAKTSLNMLILDRGNEFRELANAMDIPLTSPDWQETILKYCIDFSEIFKDVLMDKKGPNDQHPDDHNKMHQCLTLMRQIAKDKQSMIQITHLQNIAYTLSQEFKTIYQRIE
ncbi:MAG: hypothetical protein HW420_117 [Candidatus Nitrosotenuis sp.]|jgi:hypothetical protein|nr:hypothetical protein [Candidatus Nitrosotenuis sp.]